MVHSTKISQMVPLSGERARAQGPSCFTNKGPAIQIPVPKGRTAAGKFYKYVVLRKLKNYYKVAAPKKALKYVRLLHDNAPAHKARIVTDFLES